MNTANGKGAVAPALARQLTRARALALVPPPDDALAPPQDMEKREPLGLKLRMNAPAILVGLGTTGTKMMDGVVGHLRTELGRVPACLNYLGIDGASRDHNILDQGHFVRTDNGGCGTLPSRGQHQWNLHYDEIRLALDYQMQTISASDPEVPVDHLTQECLDVVLFAGCGGASGGMLHPTISLAHAVARLRRIRHPRIHAILMGPDMPMRDSSRSVQPRQISVVTDTFSSNLVKIFADITSSAIVEEIFPDGTTLRMAAADRVWSVTLFDQSNGSFDWSTTDDLVEMIAWDAFLAIFTQQGKFVEDRVKDLEQLGITARATL